MGWGRGGKLRDEDEEGMGCGEGLISFSHFSNEPAGLCCGLGCLACFHFPENAAKGVNKEAAPNKTIISYNKLQ